MTLTDKHLKRLGKSLTNQGRIAQETVAHLCLLSKSVGERSADNGLWPRVLDDEESGIQPESVTRGGAGQHGNF